MHHTRTDPEHTPDTQGHVVCGLISVTRPLQVDAQTMWACGCWGLGRVPSSRGWGFSGVVECSGTGQRWGVHNPMNVLKPGTCFL